MRLIQWIAERALPEKWARALREESKAWMIRCACGFEKSLWDAGGIRCGGGRRKKILGVCPRCRKARWMDLVRR